MITKVEEDKELITVLCNSKEDSKTTTNYSDEYIDIYKVIKEKINSTIS